MTGETQKGGEKALGAASAASEALPAEPTLVATELVARLKDVVSLRPEEQDQLQALIKDVVLEKMGLVDDIRMGRILGSAIATI